MTHLLRFKWWVIELVSSLVVACSFVPYFQHDDPIGDDEAESKIQWVFYASIASIVLSSLGIVVSAILPQTELVGSPCRIESILVWLTGGLWSISTVTSIVGRFDQDMSVIDESYIAERPNLYFFTFCCLIMSILLISSWFLENISTEDSLTTTQWMLLGTMSFFVVISGIAFRNSARSSLTTTAPDHDNGTYSGSNSTTSTTTITFCEAEPVKCHRVNVSIVLGGISAAVACVITPWRGAGLKCQTDVSAMLFTAWFVAIWFLTFDSGPGRSWGNLYFGTWANFFLSLNILIVSSTMDETTRKLANQRTGSRTLGRDDVWEEALERLDMTKWQQSAGGLKKTDSYTFLFSPAEEWPDNLDDGCTLHAEDPIRTGDVRASAMMERARIRASQVKRLETWSTLGVASAVNLAAMLPTLEKIGAARFPTTIPSISIVVSFLGFATCLRKSNVAKRIQAGSVRQCYYAGGRRGGAYIADGKAQLTSIFSRL
jgi:hypothetical protein